MLLKSIKSKEQKVFVGLLREKSKKYFFRKAIFSIFFCAPKPRKVDFAHNFKFYHFFYNLGNNEVFIFA